MYSTAVENLIAITHNTVINANAKNQVAKNQVSLIYILNQNHCLNENQTSQLEIG